VYFYTGNYSSSAVKVFKKKSQTDHYRGGDEDIFNSYLACKMWDRVGNREMKILAAEYIQAEICWKLTRHRYMFGFQEAYINYVFLQQESVLVFQQFPGIFSQVLY